MISNENDELRRRNKAFEIENDVFKNELNIMKFENDAYEQGHRDALNNISIQTIARALMELPGYRSDSEVNEDGHISGEVLLDARVVQARLREG